MTDLLQEPWNATWRSAIEKEIITRTANYHPSNCRLCASGICFGLGPPRGIGSRLSPSGRRAYSKQERCPARLETDRGLALTLSTSSSPNASSPTSPLNEIPRSTSKPRIRDAWLESSAPPLRQSSTAAMARAATMKKERAAYRQLMSRTHVPASHWRV
eukprot:TRINITY_DN114289_c0_g1_i1.p1 TRINITY_DN114289_c0_g1~~TRINITY_DN114289_c0_g1_i1.p1  ORF type:complete len:159 (+),score=14.87 TRINITY_DN114289_c0_g1_i1:62-538(+)